MTQLTDKIREGILGNVGTIMSGRLGVTDAELMEKAFLPVFKAEDLHKQGNFQAIATVMMNNLPSSPFTMALIPPMGEANPELLETMKAYSAAKYGRTRAEVEAEIKERWKSVKKDEQKVANEKNVGPIGQLEQVQSKKLTTKKSENEKESFLNAWKKKREEKRAGKMEDDITTSHKENVPSSEKKTDEMTFKVERKKRHKLELE